MADASKRNDDQSQNEERLFLSTGSNEDDIPLPTLVERVAHNKNKNLLQSLAESLLTLEKEKLKIWAANNFLIDRDQSATDILFLLFFEKGVIKAAHLNQLCDFFSSIARIDLVYITEEFLLGNYNPLRQLQALQNRRVGKAQTPLHGEPTTTPGGAADDAFTSKSIFLL